MSFWSVHGIGWYLLSRPIPARSGLGVVRTTEVRIAPEIGGQLVAIKVHKGDSVRAGDVVAELSAVELTASVAQARAALAAATANRNHVYAGVRAEQVATLAAEIAKAKSRLEYAEGRNSRAQPLLRSSDTASQQALDQADNDAAAAQADVAEARSQPCRRASPARPRRSGRSPTRRCKAAAAALAVLERQLGKTVLRTPGDGIVSVIVAEVGENVHAGQPVLAIAAAGKQWLSFNVREDLLHGLTVGTEVAVARAGVSETTQQLSPSWCRSARSPLGRPSVRSAITIAVRCGYASIRKAMRPILEPGMTVWISR